MNLEEIRKKFAKILEIIHNDLATVRTGRATPSLVEHIMVSCYGGTQKLRVVELATIVAQDTQTIVITPFDNSIIGEVQKGITEANVGLNPVIDGQLIRISIPQLSEERRQELIHLMKQKLENGRIMARQIRHEAMNDVKKEKETSEDEVSRLEKEIQKMTDEIMTDIDAIGKKKEEELLQI
ncbi:MAG: ribosome recycling factor [Patescibacteria group bacterium]